jgi:ABC-type phosphate transport system substrate-binding protein
MKRITLSVVLLAAGLAVRAADFVVVTNPSISAAEISGEDLKQVFLGSKTSLGGVAVEPVLATGGAAHEAFLRECVAKSDAALRSYFKSLVFTGKGSMPKSLPNDAAIVQYVAKTKGAIAYVAASAVTAEVRKLPVK